MLSVCPTSQRRRHYLRTQGTMLSYVPASQGRRHYLRTQGTVLTSWQTGQTCRIPRPSCSRAPAWCALQSSLCAPSDYLQRGHVSHTPVTRQSHNPTG
ncbi:hypothetical protein FKM82_029363 [Ascaphus truei]